MDLIWLDRSSTNFKYLMKNRIGIICSLNEINQQITIVIMGDFESLIFNISLQKKL